MAREAATDNINARLTSIEDFVGSKYGNSVGVDYPSVTVALNKTVSRLEELYIKLESISVSLPGIREAVQVMSFMRRADLGRDISSGPNQASHSDLEEQLNMLTQNVATLDNSIAHLTNMLGVMWSQTGLENMVMELGGKIFKGEDDVHAWMEIDLPNTSPFGVFVDVYTIMELVLVGHTNVQAQIMEQIMKLKLEADEALVIKTFKNKLPSLFGLKAEEGNAYHLVTSTQDSWLPGLANYAQWETSN
eukprot:10142420-Ditylum_brightwellii.AAC.3